MGLYFIVGRKLGFPRKGLDKIPAAGQARSIALKLLVPMPSLFQARALIYAVVVVPRA
jgi:hypothetical protein